MERSGSCNFKKPQQSVVLIKFIGSNNIN